MFLDYQKAGKPGEFREDAVKQQQAGERFNNPLVLVGIKGWLSLVAVALLVATSIVWMLAASIPLQVTGSGIILSGGGAVSVDAPCSGVISEVLAGQGDILEQGDLIARIDTSPGDSADDSTREISAPSRGRLEILHVWSGDSIGTGELLFTLEPDTSVRPVLQAVLYLAPSDASKVQAGMSAHVDPASTDRTECGYMLGHVASVSYYPSTSADIATYIGDQNLPEEWTVDGPLIRVTVSLITDTATVSGYSWTSRNGPGMAIHTGTLCQGEIITGQTKPIDLILPSETSQTN